jgi:hypothetical protein
VSKTEHWLGWFLVGFGAVMDVIVIALAIDQWCL